MYLKDVLNDIKGNQPNYDKISIVFPMRPLHNYGFISMTSSDDKPVNVECSIDESRYNVDDGYKITLVSQVEGFGQRHLYQTDLLAIIQAGKARILVDVPL